MAEKKNIFEKWGLITKEKFNVTYWQVFSLVDGSVKDGVNSYTYGKRKEKRGNYNDFSPLARVTYENFQLTNRGKLAFTAGFASILYAGVQIASTLKLIP